MKFLLLLGVVGCVLHGVTAPPVTQKNTEDDSNTDTEPYVEYHRYLSQVVEALETDPEFREKLQKAEEADIRSGKISQELDFVNHNVRTKLDEIKRQELERLRHLANKQFELQNELDTDHAKVSVQLEHLDHNNPHTFEIEDLKKLIIKTSEDLMEADKKRRVEFKEYEMQKEYEKQQKMQTLDEEHKKEYEKELHDMEEKHKKHEPLHHPGSRDHLQEVWKNLDKMDLQDFNLLTFFQIHDVDGNGLWDQIEVKALFVKELDKLYKSGLPEDDIRERQEEMERMREHVFVESDTNRDGFISYEEFLTETRKAEFEKDEGWKGLDEQQLYTQEEYREFERRRIEEFHRMSREGDNSLHPNFQGQQYHPQPGYPQQPQYGQQYHPNALPQGQFQQPHPNYPPGQMQYPQGQPQHPQLQHGQYPQMPQGQAPYQQGQVQQAQGQPQYPQGQAPHQQGQAQHPQAQYPQGQAQHPQVQAQQPQPQAQYPQAQAQHPQAQAQHPQAQAQHPQAQAQHPQGQAPNPQGQAQHPQAQAQNPQQPQGQVQQPQGQVQQPQGQVQQPQDQVQQPQGQVQQPQGQIQNPQQLQPSQGQNPNSQNQIKSNEQPKPNQLPNSHQYDSSQIHPQPNHV